MAGNTPVAGDAPSYLNYIQNKGQWDAKVLFRSAFRGGQVYVENTAFTYLFYPKEGIDMHHFHDKEHGREEPSNGMRTFHALRMDFVGAQTVHPIVSEDVQPFYHNYFLGNDPKKWASEVHLYQTVIHKNMYNNIDVKVFGRGNNVRYDFIVGPDANVADIVLKFTGQNDLSLRNGQLVISTSGGEVVQEAPHAYQLQKNGSRLEVACHYILVENKLSITVTGRYDKTLPLVIDPTLIFSTYTGSLSDNWGMSATYDQVGNAYTAGVCFGPNYPTTSGAFQVNFMGPGSFPGGDISLSKFNTTGTNLLFSTYLGGAQTDVPQSITVDNNNCLIVLGRTYSRAFPTVAGCFDVTKNNDTITSDIIVTKFNASGSGLLASTYVGGSGNDGINITDVEATLSSLKRNYADDGRGAIHVDAANNVYVASCTTSTDFPVSAGCFQATKGAMQDGCVFKMPPTLTSMLFSTYLGGSNDDAAYNLAIDNLNQVYVTGGTKSSNFPTTAGSLHPSAMGGTDGFVTHMAANGGSILQSSYIGTSSYEQSYFVQIDNFGYIYLYGQCSGNYPISANTYSNANSGQFIHKLDANLSSTMFSTEFGSGRGTPDIVPSAFLVDDCRNIYVSGWGGPLYGYNVFGSSTTGMPITSNATGYVQTTTDGSDFYFAAFRENAQSLQYATYFGGASSLEHVDGGTSCFDKTGMVYQAICASCGGNQDMPTTPGAWSTTNGSYNCNNGLVKFQLDMINTVAQANLNLFSKEGCAPFTANFVNYSANAVTYNWNFGDGNSSTMAAPSYTYINPGTYTVTLIATDPSTCNKVDTALLTITVYPPALQVPPLTPTTICKGDSVTLSVNFPTANSCTWTPTNGLQNPLYINTLGWPASSTIYTLTLYDSLCGVSSTRTVQVNVKKNNTTVACTTTNTCPGGTVQVMAFGANSYQWSTGETSSSISGSLSGLYYVTSVDSTGCRAVDSIHIYRDISLTPISLRTCQGQGVILTAPQGYQYNWQPATGLSNSNTYNPMATPPSTSIYTLTLSNGTCVTVSSNTVIIDPMPALRILNNRTSLCSIDTVQLRADSAFASYQWSNGLTTPTINILSTGLYSLTVTNTNGCKASDTMFVRLYLPMAIKSSSAGICQGQYSQIFAPIGDYSYAWYPNQYLSANNISNPIATPKATSIYTLVVSNGPCIISVTHTIVVNPVPQLSLNLKTISLLPGETVQLIAKSDTICSWYPVNGLSCNECNAPIASPDERTTYYCYVVNSLGCGNTQTVTVDVTPTFYVPNTFTPNGDGLNDLFRPSFSGYVELSVSIFDRWGAFIYSYNTLDGGWDGSFKGQPAQQGEYVYKIVAKDHRNKRLEKNGPFLLLR